MSPRNTKQVRSIRNHGLKKIVIYYRHTSIGRKRSDVPINRNEI